MFRQAQELPEQMRPLHRGLRMYRTGLLTPFGDRGSMCDAWMQKVMLTFMFIEVLLSL